MSFVSFITKLFGNKSTRDLKEIEPIVRQIEELGPQVKELTIDGLRDAITDIRNDIKTAVAPLRRRTPRYASRSRTSPLTSASPSGTR